MEPPGEEPLDEWITNRMEGLANRLEGLARAVNTGRAWLFVGLLVTFVIGVPLILIASLFGY
jgi:hypothetical protein